jgi:hypothetical protein
MPTKEQLFQQKADIEQQIKEFVEQLTTLSDEAKENTQNEIIKLEHQREEIIQQLIGKIKEELSTVSQEVEKKPLQDQLEKYEREVWENQSYYTGVIALIEQDNSAAGRTLLDVIKEKPLSITPEQVETAAERITISTYELLKGSMTAEKLKIALSHSSLDQRFKTLGVGTDPEKRLEKTLERAHEVAKQFVEWKIFDNEAEKAQNAELLNYCHNVIAP